MKPIKGYQEWHRVFESYDSDPELGKSTVVDMPSYRIEKFKRVWITRPTAEPAGTVIIYGGLLDTPDEVLKDIPEELLKSKIVAIARWDKGVNFLINKLKQLTSNRESILSGAPINITSVNGFSTGALSIKSVIGDYPFTGLIDPWLSRDLLDKLDTKKDRNIESWFSKKFWKEQLGKWTQTISLQERLKGILGDRAIEKPDHEHEQVKKDFLKQNWSKM